MTEIDPTARVESGAAIGPGVTIGPHCVIGPNVVIGEGSQLVAQVHLTGHTSIGPRTVIYPFASLGTPPQSVKYRGGPTRLVVGAQCQIREGVTMNTGTEEGGGVTTVGDRCFLMVGSHVGHDCRVGKDVTFANNAVLGGHVVVGDNVFFGGQAAVHQFVRIGEGAMIGGLSGASEDVVPFGFVLGTPKGNLVGLNIVGLRRRGVSRSDMHRLRQAYRMLFYGKGRFAERTEMVSREFEGDPLVGKIVAFIRDGGSRPLMKARAARAGGTFADAEADG
jgi:UDP-N-acetylglucosamine acyltransferase